MALPLLQGLNSTLFSLITSHTTDYFHHFLQRSNTGSFTNQLASAKAQQRKRKDWIFISFPFYPLDDCGNSVSLCPTSNKLEGYWKSLCRTPVQPATRCLVLKVNETTIKEAPPKKGRVRTVDFLLFRLVSHFPLLIIFS